MELRFLIAALKLGFSCGYENSSGCGDGFGGKSGYDLEGIGSGYGYGDTFSYPNGSGYGENLET